MAEGYGFQDDRDAYAMENIFFVPKEARWSTIAAAAHTPEIGIIIDKAMRAIEADNKTLKNVLPKNYASPDLDKRVLGEVVDIFTNKIDMSNIEESEDLLGRTYEYCIAQFAEKEGAGGGEFYTPSSVVKTLVSIIRPFNNCRVYDCCCGSRVIIMTTAHSDDEYWALGPLLEKKYGLMCFLSKFCKNDLERKSIAMIIKIEVKDKYEIHTRKI